MGNLKVYDVSVLMPDMTVAEHQTVVVREGRIADIRFYVETDREESGKNADIIEGQGKLLMPGLCDCHMHTGQQLLKGRILDALPMIWTRIMLPFESTLDVEKMRLSAELAALEMIRAGTTAFVDAGGYFMEAAAQVYADSGLRGVLSASTMDDPDLPDSIRCSTEEALEQTDRLYDRFHGKGNLKVAYSLRSLLSCSEKLTVAAADRARERDTLLQAHMNEYPNEINFFLEKKQMRPLEYLEHLGVLDAHFVSAHSILLSEKEKDILKKYAVKVCHCPFSNCGKGVPDTPALLQRGVCTALGSDGASHGGLSLWNEMKILRSVMNVSRGVSISEPAVMPAETLLKMASENGYRLIGEDGGGIACGKKADFITIDLRQPHLYPTGNVVNTLLESVTASDVCDNIVGGKILMKDRIVRTLDEKAVLRAAQNYMERQEQR